MAEHIFHNTDQVIDKSNHWSLLLYQESLAIQRYKLELRPVLYVEFRSRRMQFKQ
jgi:hypothetical protein